MIYDLAEFAAIGLGSEGTTPKPDGNHLRWGFAGDLPFPPKGFDVYRRASGRGERKCLDFRNEHRGRRYLDDFSIDGFAFWSGETVEVVETEPPAGLPELYLRRVKAMRIHLPGEALAVTLGVAVKSRFAARAYAGSVLVDQGELKAASGVQELTLRGQGIDLVVIDAAEAILVRICYTRPPELKEGAKLEDQGWEHIAGPLALPETFAEGLPRILFDPVEIESAYDDWMGQAIKVCLDTSDPIASALRTLQFLEGAGIVTSGTPSGGKATFDIKSQSMLLLAAIDPDVARFLGLGFVDQTAPLGVTFDYLVVGDWVSDERYCFVTGLTRGPAPALPAPTAVSGTAFPVGGSSMAVGVAWTLPLAGNGYLLTSAAITYDVRAALVAPAAQTSPPSPSTVSFPSTPANGEDRIIPARRRTISGIGGYPEYLFTHFKRPEGWWAYEAMGFDIFGRESAWSAPAFVRVLDLIPPPAPTVLLQPQPGPSVPPNEVVRFPLRARYLESGDPELTAADRALVTANGGPVTVVEWNWLPEQAQLAPDTGEFRVYFHPRFRTESATLSSVGPPSDTSATVTLSGVPSFDAVGGELVSRGRGFVVTSQSGTVLTVAPSRTGKADGTVELGVPSTGLAQLTEGWRNSRIWQTRSAVEPVTAPASGYYRAVIPDILLGPTSAQPLATGWIGVTAADDKAYVPDDPARGGALAGRIGNESTIAVRQQIHAVDRTPPPPGPVPTAPQFASRADFFGRSRCRVTFPVAAPATYHIWRAVESSVVASDLKARKARAGTYAAGDPFADDPGFAAWLAANFPTVPQGALFAEPLAGGAKAAWEAWAARFYARAALTDGQLQAIASRAPNEGAFAQLTKEALPLGAYDDEFDGRLASRYLYRMQAVFPNGLRGPLSGAGIPVRLHDVVPPRTPAITGITLADRAATVTWTRSPDADLDHYEVYREARTAAPPLLDRRRMTHVGGDIPSGATSVTDTGLVPGREYLYIALAVDTSGNRSQPSEPRSVRAIGTTGPPVPTATATRAADGTVDLAWTGAEEGSRALVERRATGAAFFVAVTGWLAAGVAAYNDAQAPADPLEYRVRLQDGVGMESQPSAGVVAPAT